MYSATFHPDVHVKNCQILPEKRYLYFFPDGSYYGIYFYVDVAKEVRFRIDCFFNSKG